MKTTAELIERISPRYKKVRNKNLEFLWEDFLQAVEKVINKLPDEILAATSGITIFYFTKDGDKNVYRSKIAECSFFESQTVEYEEKDICLGTREMLEVAFIDFKAKAEEDVNICTDFFDLTTFRSGEVGDSKIPLSFLLFKIL